MILLFSFLNIVATISCTLLRGYVLSLMWSWFVLALFPEWPHLSVLVAIGLVQFTALLRLKDLTVRELESLDGVSEDREKYAASSLYATIISVIVTLIAWLGAWIVHSFM